MSSEHKSDYIYYAEYISKFSCLLDVYEDC